MLYTEVLFQRSSTLNLNHMNNRRGEVINLEGARIDGNHCKSLPLPSGMIMWRKCWCGAWLARGSHLTHRHDGQRVCLQRTNLTSAHRGVVMTWSSHLSATSPCFVWGMTGRKRSDSTAETKDSKLVLGGGFVPTTLVKLLSLQAFHTESFRIPQLSFPPSKHC